MDAEPIKLNGAPDSGPDGPSNACDDGCRDDAQASKIKFNKGSTKAEVDQLFEENWSSNYIEILVGELRSPIHITGSVRRVRWRLSVHLVRRVDIKYVNGFVDSYNVI